MEIPVYRPTITLIPNSGVHFLDFAFQLADARKVKGDYWEQPKNPDSMTGSDGQASHATGDADAHGPGTRQVVLRKLRPDDDDNLVFWDEERNMLVAAPDNEEEAYAINFAKISESLFCEWIPIPLLRITGIDENKRETVGDGPSTWARVFVAPKEEDSEGSEIHRVVMAIDTMLKEPVEGRPYLAPTPQDSEDGNVFKFCHDHEDNAWFMSQPWVAMWLQEVFRDSKIRKKGGKPLSADDMPYACEHWARYATFLDMLGSVITVPEIKLVDVVSSELNYQPIDVDLVLDIGNSRTCGVLIESIPDRSFDFNSSYVLELRDLACPWKVYAEPFESRVEFCRASFGRDGIARRAMRADAFAWPGLVRVGHEAGRLARELDGTEGSTGLSSPKRYLWDRRLRSQPWRLNVANSPPWVRDTDVRGAATTLLADDGEVLSLINVKPGHELPAPAVQAQFSRSSLFTLMLAEILFHALAMMNAPNTRGKRQMSDVPRRLRRLILTVPPATPLAERRILRHRVGSAIRLVWELLGWDISFSPIHKPPTFHLEWDEASCTHIVYLYTEITQKLHSNAGDFFELLGRVRREVSSSPSMRIASIDIGGGTTDLMITTYSVEDERSIVPQQEFREGFKIAGDDILESIIDGVVLKTIEDSLIGAGVGQARELLQELFGGDRAGMAEQTKARRAVFVNRILVPIAIGLIADYERTRLICEAEPVARRFEEYFPEDQIPTSDITNYLEDAAKARGAEDFSLRQITIPAEEPDGVPKTRGGISFVMNPTVMAGVVAGVIGEVLSDLCEVIHAYDCDALLLSGRPSKMPVVRDLVLTHLPVSPDRVITMHDYHAGSWYPLCRQPDARGRSEDDRRRGGDALRGFGRRRQGFLDAVEPADHAVHGTVYRHHGGQRPDPEIAVLRCRSGHRRGRGRNLPGEDARRHVARLSPAAHCALGGNAAVPS